MQGKELTEGSKQPVEWFPMILAMKLALRSSSLHGEDVGVLSCRAEAWERCPPKASLQRDGPARGENL